MHKSRSFGAMLNINGHEGFSDLLIKVFEHVELDKLEKLVVGEAA